MKHPEQLRRAASRLLRKSPFLGLFLVRLPLRPDPTVQVAEVDGVEIRYNPDNLRMRPLEHVTTILAHVIYHVLLLHHVRRGDRDPTIWNVAGDMVINLMLRDLGFDLPRSAVYSFKYRGMSTEQVYAVLTRNAKPGNSASAGAAGGASAAGSAASSDEGDESKASQGGRPGPSGGRPGSDAQSGAQQGATDFVDSTSLGEVVDAPAPPPTGQGSQGVGGGEGCRRGGLETEGAVQIATFQAIAHARRIGKPIPHAIERKLGVLYDTESRLDWHDLLHRFVERCTGLRGDAWSYLKPQPYFLQQGIILPSLVSETIDYLPVAIDTSGSMSARELAAVERELRKILVTDRIETLRLLHVDTEVRRDVIVHAGQPWNLQARGGGGTDFRPLFEQLGPDVPGLIYLTDLVGHFPDRPPPFPTLWVTPATVRRRDVPFGEVVSMLDDR